MYVPIGGIGPIGPIGPMGPIGGIPIGPPIGAIPGPGGIMGPPIIPACGPLESSSLSPTFLLPSTKQKTLFILKSPPTQAIVDLSQKQFPYTLRELTFSHLLSLMLFLVLFRNTFHSINFYFYIVSTWQSIRDFVYLLFVHLAKESWLFYLLFFRRLFK